MTTKEALATTVKTLHEAILLKRELLDARADLDLGLSNCDSRIADATDELVRLVRQNDGEEDEQGGGAGRPRRTST